LNVAAAIYEQSVNVRKMSPVWWYATWWILARYVGIAAGLTACRNAAIGNLWYKFVPKGYIPLRDLYQICRGVGSPRSAQSRKISPLWLLKCGLRAPEIIKIGNLSYKFAKKGYTPVKISTKFGLGEGVPGTYAPSRQILPLWLYKCGLAARKIAEIGNFWYIFAPKGYIPFINVYKIWRRVGPPRSPQSLQLSPLWL